MIKLRNFWVALAIGCAFSMGTSSCGDDDEDEPKQEQVDKATEAGSVMKDVVDSYNLKGADLLDQATSMTKEQLQNLAETVVEYNKNKNNAEWMQKFLVLRHLAKLTKRLQQSCWISQSLRLRILVL